MNSCICFACVGSLRLRGRSRVGRACGAIRYRRRVGPNAAAENGHPHHYAIAVTPHAERLAFDGTVAIDLEIVKPTSVLVLNAADLRFSKATLCSAG